MRKIYALAWGSVNTRCDWSAELLNWESCLWLILEEHSHFGQLSVQFWQTESACRHFSRDVFSASRAACSPRLPRVLSSLVCFSPPWKRTRIVARGRYLVKHVLTYESDHFNLGFNINLILLAQLRIDNKHRYRQSINVKQVNRTISMSLHDNKLLRDQKFLEHDSLFTSYYHYYLLSFF